jgi:hypothetical protein
MTTAPQARAAFIAGLLDLACFLDAHPEVPVPAYGRTIGLSIDDGTDEQNRAQVDTFAAMLGATITDRNGHYTASRRFGPVEYQAFAIRSDVFAAYEALQSYRGCVYPEPADLGEVT